MTSKGNFFGINDDKLYFDERKKRFVFLQDAPAVAQKAFNQTHFKEVPPQQH
jgi:hypothetical protein